MAQEEFVTMAEAAKRLKVSKTTISRTLNRYKDQIPTKSDTMDTRLILVEYNALHKIVTSSIKYRK